MFTIIPALDILHGKCVRLTQGVYTDSTTYSDNPLEVAEKWQSMGAKKIHLVDLDGAKNGVPVNFEVIRGIIKKVKCSFEVGGGIRTMQDIENYLEAGAKQVILGSILFKDEALTKKAFKKYAKRLIAGVDLQDGQVKISGWLENTNKSGPEAISRLSELGARTFIITDIARDGTLSGPNFELYRSISSKIDIIASGGVTSLQDIQDLKKIGNITGCILGKALYEGKLELSAALELEE